jgi:hypothetical protein
MLLYLNVCEIAMQSSPPSFEKTFAIHFAMNRQLSNVESCQEAASTAEYLHEEYRTCRGDHLSLSGTAKKARHELRQERSDAIKK